MNFIEIFCNLLVKKQNKKFDMKAMSTVWSGEVCVGCSVGVCLDLLLRTFGKGHQQLIRTTFKTTERDRDEITANNWRRLVQTACKRIWIMFLLTVAAITFANLFLCAGVFSFPLLDQGPHVVQGWGQVVRLRHLYAVSPGLHLLITEDGLIRGSADQTSHSKTNLKTSNFDAVRVKVCPE